MGLIPAVALLLSSMTAAEAPVAPLTTGSEFEFELPDGWLSLLPGAPEENFRLAGEVLTAQARSHPFVFDAVELREGKVAAFANAQVIPVRQNITPGSPLVFARSLMNGRDASQTIQSADLVTFRGVDAIRVVIAAKDTDLVQTNYLLPGRAQSAILQFTCTKAIYASYAPQFGKFAAATRGIAKADSDEDLILHSLGGGVGAIALVVAIILAIKGARNRAKKK